MPEIDAEHQAVFHVAGRLQKALRETAPASTLQDLLGELAAHAGDHFTHEEQLMRLARCDSYAWHKRQHETARAKVAECSRRLRRGDREAVGTFLDFLAGWLRDHMSLADRIMAAAIRSHVRSHAA